MMTSSSDESLNKLLDRGMRQYNYRISWDDHSLQQALQRAGSISERVKLVSGIEDMQKPRESVAYDAGYNKLIRRLNQSAENPAVINKTAWAKVKTDVLKYFDSGLRIYADAKPFSAKGYHLDTLTRKLYYCDGTGKEEATKEIADFRNNIREWGDIQRLFPTLFNPSVAVSMGFVDNYTTLQPEKYMQLIYKTLGNNPGAEFDRDVSQDFIQLYANLDQYMAIGSLLEKHEDLRTVEQLVLDIVEGINERIHKSLTTKKAITTTEIEILQHIIDYFATGDYLVLVDALPLQESSWFTSASTWFYTSEVDSTLNLIKELRQSPFFEETLKKFHAENERKMLAREGASGAYSADQKREDARKVRDGEMSAKDFATAYGLRNIVLAPEGYDVELSGPFQGEALAELTEEQEVALQTEISRVLSDEVSLQDEEETDVDAVVNERVYEFESHIVDFESSEEDVNAMWDECRVTKEAFKASLVAMAEKLEALQTENEEVELPPIPLAQDLLLEEADQEEKTIIDHIKDSISRLQQKVDADKSKSKKTFYQTDCASLQNSINKILAYQFVGQSNFMLTEEQRSVYNDVGAQLTDILYATEKKPRKDLEVLSSVVPVREEIQRLMAFHDSIRSKLTEFKEQLRSIDQGTFFNDIQKFVAKGAALDKSQLALQTLLDNLVDCQDVEFNVLAPENEWQRKVVAAVNELTSWATGLVDELQDVLLNQQIPVAEEEDPKPRKYINVTPKKDATYAGRFGTIMEGIRAFAETLHAQETSRLETYFEEKVPSVTESYLSMFSHTADRGKQGGNTFGNDFGSDLGSNNGRNGRK